MKKIVLLAFVLVLLSPALVARFVRPVVADGTIYIRADGSIDPPTANITSLDNVTYTFTGNINDYIVVERDSIVVDGAGYTLQGPGLYSGIYLEDRSNVTIKNVEVTNLGYGIVLISSNNNTLTGNNASNNDHYGIYLHSSNNNTLNGNTASDNDYYGIYLFSSNSNTLTGNTVSNNYWNGIYLESSNNNTLSGNNASNNSDGIRLYGSNNNTLTGNTASHNGDGIYLESSNNNTLTGNTASHNGLWGIHLYGSNNNTLTGNIASPSNSLYGIYLDSSSNNTLSGNTVSNNDWNGIYLASSSNDNVLTGNTASHNYHYGITLSVSSNNVLTGNTASHNYPYPGIGIYGSNNNTLTGNTASHNGDGIYLSSSNNNTLTGNTASDNRIHGIYLASSNSNTLTGNIASNNWDGYGIYLASSSNNTLTNNTMSGNEYNFGLYGAEASHFYNTIDDSNTVDDKLIYYLKGVNDTVYNTSSVPDAGTLYLIDCTNITIGNLTLKKNGNGVFLWNTTNSNIQNVTVSNNRHGIYLQGQSNCSNLTDNTVSNNFYGIYLDSSNNTIYHNNFIDNSMQARVTESYINVWDDGYPSGGNYWSDYAGVDLFSGPHQNVSSCDGIGDTPHVIDVDNRDNYPLMEPYPDTKPPTITILSPENKAYATTSIPLAFTIYECTRRIWYSLDGESNVTITGNTTLSGLSEGVHTIVVHANDTIGNMGSSDIVHFTVDTVFPNINILSPENKTYTTSSVSLDFAVSEPTSWMGYSLDGAVNGTITGNTTLTGLLDGAHYVVVYANDTAGNMGTSSTVYFTVDATPPSIMILSPENKTYPVNDVPLTFTVDEPTDWIGYSLNGQANVTITGNTTLTGLLDGAHYVVVYANDTAGNMGTSSTVYFTVDTTSPNITDVSQTPPENNVLPQDEVEVNATVTDYVSGVKQATLNYTNGNGTWITVDMTNLEGNIWNATIPAFPYCTNVTYIIIAEDNANNTMTTEEMGYEYQYHVIPEFPTWTSFLLILIALTIAIALSKRKLLKTPIH